MAVVDSGWTAKATEVYLGPWNTPTPGPVLVISNTFDPAHSSRQFASAKAEELADGHPLTVQGFGHTQPLNPSRCAQDYVAAFFVDGTVPVDGTECQQDDPPFSSSRA